jgi:hypothetical protein
MAQKMTSPLTLQSILFPCPYLVCSPDTQIVYHPRKRELDQKSSIWQSPPGGGVSSRAKSDRALRRSWANQSFPPPSVTLTSNWINQSKHIINGVCLTTIRFSFWIVLSSGVRQRWAPRGGLAGGPEVSQSSARRSVTRHIQYHKMLRYPRSVSRRTLKLTNYR